MDLLLELSMCVWFKLIYFAIRTLSVFMVGFVSLYFLFFIFYFLGFCSTLILLIGTNFLKDFRNVNGLWYIWLCFVRNWLLYWYIILVSQPVMMSCVYWIVQNNTHFYLVNWLSGMVVVQLSGPWFCFIALVRI